MTDNIHGIRGLLDPEAKGPAVASVSDIDTLAKSTEELRKLLESKGFDISRPIETGPYDPKSRSFMVFQCGAPK